MSLNEVCRFPSRQIKGQVASNSELKRWCNDQVLKINNKVIAWDENIPLPEQIETVTLFSKQNKVTIL